jgi:hypothetical protein
MPTSIRLDPRSEDLLRRLAKRRKQTKSEVVRAAIHALARDADAAEPIRRRTALDRMAHVIGTADSGGAALSTDTGARFRTLLGQHARGRAAR